jgi:hypothetical protein
VRPVVSFTISKPAVRKFSQIKRRRKLPTNSRTLESMIDETHAREFATL